MAKSKKGAEMTVGTIIIIVLALIVLVVLVVGFTGGWSNLWGRITNFFGGSNVDSIVQACQVACTTEQKYEYCDRMRDVKFDDKTKNGKYNCVGLEKLSLGLEFCDAGCSIKNCADLNGEWETESDCKKQDLTLMVTNETEKGVAISGTICCAK